MPLAPPFMGEKGGRKAGTELMHQERPIESEFSDTTFLWPRGRSVASTLRFAGL